MSREIDLNKQGILLHGIDTYPFTALRRIKAGGLKPWSQQEDPLKPDYASFFPDVVSFSMVGEKGYNSASAVTFFGAGKGFPFRQAVTLVVNPEFIADNRDKFSAVGLDFHTSKAGWEPRFPNINGRTLHEIRCLGPEGKAYPDEVQYDGIVPFEGVVLLVMPSFFFKPFMDGLADIGIPVFNTDLKRINL